MTDTRIRICDCCRRPAFLVCSWSSPNGAIRRFCGDCARLLDLDEPLNLGVAR